MSLVTEILDRLSGIAVVREKLNEATRHVDKISTWLLDHEKRLILLEAKSLPPEDKRKGK